MSKLPPGWAHSTLGEVCEPAQYGWTTSAAPHRTAGLHFLRTTDITKGPIDWNTVPRCLEEPPDPDRYRLSDGDIVISRAGSVGFSAYLEKVQPSIFASYLIRFRPSLQLDGRYLGWFLKSPDYWRQITAAASGITLSNVNAKKLAAIQVPIAPRVEQERIVSSIEEQFSRLDAGIAALKRAERSLQRMRSGVFESVTGKIESWVTLGNIAEVVGGVTKDSKRQLDPSFLEVPYLRVANVQRGYLDLDRISTIRVPEETAKRLRLEAGDVLFNEGGDRDKLGRGWIWEDEIPNCIHQNHVFRARLHPGKFDPKFVSMHGNTFGKTWFDQMGKQTTNLASLNLTTLKSFPVPALTFERQLEIVTEVERQLSVIDTLSDTIETAFGRANALRTSTLAAAFSGELVPQDPSDEPAAQLLQRIASTQVAARTTRSRKPRGLARAKADS